MHNLQHKANSSADVNVILYSASSESDHCSVCYEAVLATDGFHWCSNTGCSLGYCTSLVTYFDLSKRDLSTRLVLHM